MFRVCVVLALFIYSFVILLTFFSPELFVIVLKSSLVIGDQG